MALPQHGAAAVALANLIYKRGKYYWYKFKWNTHLIRESTKQGNDRSCNSGRRRKISCCCA